MSKIKLLSYSLPIIIACLVAGNSKAQNKGHLLHHPDVSNTHITFIHAEDVWIVPKQGGSAKRLTSAKGEELFPRFSPDGNSIAFSGNYHGNVDVFVMPIIGGAPHRITHHPLPDVLVDWHPDGKKLLFSSGREFPLSAYRPLAVQLFTVSASGGTPEKLPLLSGQFSSFSPDGKMLAVQPVIRSVWQWRYDELWKRYRGGLAPDIYLYNLEKGSAENITLNKANDELPMWHGNTLYFLSDRDKHMRSNIWAYDLKTKALRQITFFADYDIQYPAHGPSEIVFEAAGQLYLLDLKTEKYKAVPIVIPTDSTLFKPYVAKVKDLIENGRLSPTGDRAVFEARGDVFVVPLDSSAKVQNITQSSGVAERYPTWAPDGKSVAFLSDRSGEYELTLRATDNPEKENIVSSLGPGFRYHLFWSPDGRHVAFTDQKPRIYIHDIKTKTTTVVDTTSDIHYALQRYKVSWSPDGRFLAYHKKTNYLNSALFFYDVATGKKHRITTGYYQDSEPVFDPTGNYLYYFTRRPGNLSYSDIDESFMYANSTKIAVAPLKASTPFLLNTGRNPSSTSELANKEKATHLSELDFASIEVRAQLLPVDAGNFINLRAAPGKIVYRQQPRTGSLDTRNPIRYFDLHEQKEQTIIDDASGYDLSADGTRMLAWKGSNYAIIEVAPGQTMIKKLRTAEMEALVYPQEEWHQLFTDAWRIIRDCFYDANMHGVDWKKIRNQYEPLLEKAITKQDVNYLIGEMMQELSCSHFLVGGPLDSSIENKRVGLPGADFSLEEGFYRITKIIKGAAWDNDQQSPLLVAGVKEGDYVLAVNGKLIDTQKDIWAAFEGLHDKRVTLTVNSIPSTMGTREVIVETLDSEARLRYLAWVEANRRKVELATKGQIGYIHVINTSPPGYKELVRQLMAQLDKKGLIIDVRYNHGGMIPDRFIELLNRKRSGSEKRRFGDSTPWPLTSVDGPQVMLTNGLCGSGGDFFVHLFKQARLGPVIGTRTWGGGVGNSGNPTLIDGSWLGVPAFPLYDHAGNLVAEGPGIEPDIEVHEDLSTPATDRPLNRAIQEIQKQLNQTPTKVLTNK